MPDDSKLEHSTVKLNDGRMDLLMCSPESLKEFKECQQNRTIKIPVNDSFETKDVRATDMMSCHEMCSTKVFYLHSKLVDREDQFTSTKLCPVCDKAALLKTHFQRTVLLQALLLVSGCGPVKELTKPNAAEQSIFLARCPVFEEVIMI
jgi:hypothetical protein